MIGSDVVTVELRRIQAEYQRRAREIEPDRYAAWQPAEMLIRAGRKRSAAMMLNQSGIFPKADDHCLEIGFGYLGWLGDLITWGVPETNLHGIELDPIRVADTQKILPLADLRVGDATALPWQDNTFRLVVASTLFTSILHSTMRRMIAGEIIRVLAPGGALLWYDFAVNNPKNKQVRKVGRKELKQLFPQLKGEVELVTLAPPLARLVAPRSWTLATLLEAVPLLRTHLLAVLVKTS